VRIAARIAQNFNFSDIVSAPSLSTVGDILGGKKTRNSIVYVFLMSVVAKGMKIENKKFNHHVFTVL
jgi:hypothetical protein